MYLDSTCWQGTVSFKNLFDCFIRVFVCSIRVSIFFNFHWQGTADIWEGLCPAGPCCRYAPGKVGFAFNVVFMEFYLALWFYNMVVVNGVTTLW